jgi:hypothetical protein
MTSSRKRRANYRNARASSGPRTVAGKAESCLNAFQHGLSVPVSVDSILATEVIKLAQNITDNDELKPLAYRIAEAQIDLVRVRRARNDLLTRAFRRLRGLFPEKEISASELVADFRELRGLTGPFPTRFMRRIADEVDVISFGPMLPDCIKALAALDRYERRALSRRKFAVRDFDAERQRKEEESEMAKLQEVSEAG